MLTFTVTLSMSTMVRADSLLIYFAVFLLKKKPKVIKENVMGKHPNM